MSALATRLISAPSSVAPLSCVSVLDVIVRRRWGWELDLAALCCRGFVQLKVRLAHAIGTQLKSFIL